MGQVNRWKNSYDAHRGKTLTTVSVLCFLLYPLFLFHVRQPWAILDPTNIVWTLHDDIGKMFLGWHLFRLDDWHLLPSVSYLGNFPHGYTVAFSGSQPLFTIFFKLFDGCLPKHFQFYGFYYLLACYLNCMGAFCLLRSLRLQQGTALIGALLISYFPPFFFRAEHINLCQHWIILFALSLFFRKALKHETLYFGILLVISCGIHLYFAPLVLGLALLKPFFREKNYPPQRIEATAVAYGVYFMAFLVSTFVYGYFWFGVSGGFVGFGDYSMNLNAIINPLTWSNYISPLPLGTTGQYEGFQYIGLGWFLFFFCYMLVPGKHRLFTDNQVKLIWLIVIVTTIVSLSNRIYLGRFLVFEYHFPLYEKMMATFRSSGRFFWLVSYLMMGIAILKLSKKCKPAFVMALLAICLVVQVLDMKRYTYPASEKSLSPVYQSLDETFRNLREKPTCLVLDFFKKKVKTREFFEAMLAAGDNDIPVTYMELSHGKSSPYNADAIGERPLFIISPLNTYVKAQHKLQYEKIVSDDIVLASPFPAEGFSKVNTVFPSLETLVRTPGDHMIIISAKDEASRRLRNHDGFIDFMKTLGSRIDQLKYRESYIGIVSGNRLVHESLGPTPLHFSSSVNGKALSVDSMGLRYGNRSSIVLEGKEYSLNMRGLNVVVIDHGGNILLSTCFDTHQQ